MPEEVVFLPFGTSPDRRANFPGWPDWALALLVVDQVPFTGDFTYFHFWIFVDDTPQHREEMAKLPGGFAAVDWIVVSGGTSAGKWLKHTVPVGSPWSAYAAGLNFLAPNVPALATLFESEEGAVSFSDFIPTPNDLLPDALLLQKTAGFYPQLIPGEILDPEEDGQVPDPPPTAQAQYPNLFAETSEVL